MRNASLLRRGAGLLLTLTCAILCVPRMCRALVAIGQEKTPNVAAQTRPIAGANPANPANPESEQKADILMAQHQYVAAIHAYEAINAPPASLLNKLGIAYERMRLYDQAKLTFSRAMESNPKFSGPENNLGTVFYVEGDYRRAERAYKHALKLDPRNASIYNNLGTLYFTRRKIHKGAEAYQQALSLDPEIFQRSAANGVQAEGSPESRALINYYLAQTCAQAGKSGSAILYLERAVTAGFHDQTKLQQDHHFDTLRETPEFQAVLESMSETHGASAARTATPAQP